MSGSVTTSNIRATSINAAASANVSPKTWVKNSGKAVDIIFQVMPPEAASPNAYPIFSFIVGIFLEGGLNEEYELLFSFSEK